MHGGGGGLRGVLKFIWDLYTLGAILHERLDQDSRKLHHHHRRVQAIVEGQVGTTGRVVVEVARAVRSPFSGHLGAVRHCDERTGRGGACCHRVSLLARMPVFIPHDETARRGVVHHARTELNAVDAIGPRQSLALVHKGLEVLGFVHDDRVIVCVAARVNEGRLRLAARRTATRGRAAIDAWASSPVVDVLVSEGGDE